MNVLAADIWSDERTPVSRIGAIKLDDEVENYAWLWRKLWRIILAPNYADLGFIFSILLSVSAGAESALTTPCDAHVNGF